MTDYRAIVVSRLDHLQAELTALAALLQVREIAAPPQPEPFIVDGDGMLERVQEQMADKDRAELNALRSAVAKRRSTGRKAAPEIIDPSSFTIDPGQAAAIIGVTRQTIDRRLHGGVPANVPGRPHNVGRGGVRARWRWGSPEDVRAWWAAVK